MPSARPGSGWGVKPGVEPWSGANGLSCWLLADAEHIELSWVDQQ